MRAAFPKATPKEFAMRVSRLVLPMLLATSALTVPNVSFGQVAIGVSIGIAPPALPVYEQPPIPAEGYLWTPGYWAYGGEGYYWVPGTWVQPPSVGLLWTPGYWGWSSGSYAYNGGYWGPHVGFYGGINYGFGYGGSGYDGGRWNNGAFAYNRAVNNIGSTHITNVYNSTVVNNHTTVNNVSYNGGTGGVAARPTAQDEAILHEQHVAPTPQQVTHVQAAQSDHTLLATANHGIPPIAATARPAELHGPGVVQAREAQPAPVATETHPPPAAAATLGGRPPLATGATSHAPGTAVGAAGQSGPVTTPPQARTAGAQPTTIQHPSGAAHPAQAANTNATHAPAVAVQHPPATVHPAQTAHVAAPGPQVAAHAPAVAAQHPQAAVHPAQTAHVAAPHPQVAAHAPVAPHPAAETAHPAPEKRAAPG
jgi:WXXGXW repeat (2 copies)